MKTKVAIVAVFVLGSILGASRAIAQVSAFTYQGQLKLNGATANGIYDFTFRLMNAPTNGVAAPVIPVNLAVAVSNGLFTTGMDFGAENFDGTNLWLEVNVRSNNTAGFTTLSPRQLLTSSPYAIRAASASNLLGVLPASQISGTILNGSLPSSPVFSGTITAGGGYAGNGGGLSNVNALTLGGLGSSSLWQLGGNNVALGQFLGSTNNQALELRVNGTRALRLEPNTNGAPNVIAGGPFNVVSNGVLGATIAGGGAANYFGGAVVNSVTGDFGTVGGGYFNTSAGFGVVNGGWDNQAAGYTSTVGGGALNIVQTNTSFSSIGGGVFNLVVSDSTYATVGGGAYNNIQRAAYSSTIGGGYGNVIQDDSFNSSISGGYTNVIASNSPASTIAGGVLNIIGPSAVAATIGGGSGNNNVGAYAAIGGGLVNTNNSPFAVIAGGQNNTIQTGADLSVISGGWLNFVQSGADQSVIAGGNAGAILSGARESFIGGGFANAIQTNASNSFIGGGGGNTNSSSISTVGGGSGNLVGANSTGSTIGGGSANFISNNATYASIGGGRGNLNKGTSATIGGGWQNAATNAYATVGGGFQNLAAGNFNGTGDSATVAGGWNNSSLGNNSFVGGGAANYASGDNGSIVGGWLHTNLTGFGFIGGGQQHLLQQFARFSVISGGDHNSILSNSMYSVISGGQLNLVGTNAVFGMIVGGSSNEVSGPFGLAAGRRAKANHAGAFVWADSTDADFASTASNQFNIRAMGGVRLETSAGSATLNGQPLLSGTVPGGSLAGTYSNAVTFNNRGNSFAGNGAALTSVNASSLSSGTVADARLSANVALLNHNQTFTGTNVFSSGGGAGRLIVSNTAAPVDTSLFTGLAFQYDTGSGEGAIMSSYNDGVSLLSFWTKPGFGFPITKQMIISRYGDIALDQGNNNNGALNNNSLAGAGLTFGTGSGEGIASKRTPGGNQYALDFYTGFINRMSILNNGFVGIGTINPARTLQVGNAGVAGSEGMIRLASRTSTGGANSRTWECGVPQTGDSLSGDGYCFVIRDADVPLNRMVIRWDNGNVGIGTNNPVQRLHVVGGAMFSSGAGGVNQTVSWTPGSASWSFTSDRNTKDRLESVNQREVLEKVCALPISEWSYIGYDQRHIGPMAQDFHAEFPLNGSTTSLNDADLHGVALAAIQGLNQKIEGQRIELQQNQTEITELKQRLETLERIIIHEKSN